MKVIALGPIPLHYKQQCLGSSWRARCGQVTGHGEGPRADALPKLQWSAVRSCTRQRRPSWLDAARTFRILGTPQGPLKLSVWSAGGDGAVHLTFILRQSLSLNFQLSNWQHWLASKLQDSAYLCPASTGLQMGSTNTQVLVSKLQASRLYVTERAVSQPHVLFGKHIETYDPRDYPGTLHCTPLKLVLDLRIRDIRRTLMCRIGI